MFPRDARAGREALIVIGCELDPRSKIRDLVFQKQTASDWTGLDDAAGRGIHVRRPAAMPRQLEAYIQSARASLCDGVGKDDRRPREDVGIGNVADAALPIGDV